MKTQRVNLAVLALLTALLCLGCGKKGQGETQGEKKDKAQSREDNKTRKARKEPTRPRKDAPRKAGKEEDSLKEKLAKFAPTKIDFNEKLLGEKDRKVVKKLLAAADIMNHLFLIQVDPKNPELRKNLAADPELAEELAYFDIMYGIWDRTAHHKPFYTERKRPAGVSYYPKDMKKEELTAHLKANPKDKEAFTSFFTLIRRKDKKLVAVPYSEAYKPHLKKAAKLLKEAAALTEDKNLANYLKLRAEAFSSNNYRKSDMAWMDLGDGKLEVVIGPYEVYEDKLFGYKAAFEAFICVRDPVYSKRLQTIAKHKTDMEKALPIPDKHKNFKRGSSLPITVVEEIYTAGDTRAGVQTLAFNLPNDEVVRQKKGYKLVLLKNVAEAKYKQILMPIAKRLVKPEVLKLLTFDSFFTNTLMHEAAHGQGPGTITVEKDGKKVKTTVNAELRDLYSVIEEAKADMTGLYLSEVMIDKGVLPKDLAKRVYASYLAGFFRSVRFGVSEAHGRANLVAFNYLREKGAITYDEKTKKFGLDFSKAKEAVKSLTREVLMLEAKGDYAGSKKFVQKYGKVPPEMKAGLQRLQGIPVDIRPEYTVLEKMKSW